MTTTTSITIACNYCLKSISLDEKYVNASSYGVDLHISCAENMRGSELITILDLDAKVMEHENWDGAEKAPGYFRKR